MKKKAHFVTFEGVEGSGKTTQVRLVAEHYSGRGVSVLTTREPGGTELGNELRALLLQARKEALSPMAELLLMEAARAQHFTHVLSPAMDKYQLVLCDRFTDATLAYQSGGRGLDRDFIALLNEKSADRLHPDLTILLDLSPQEALRRALGRIHRQKNRSADGVEDRFEQEALSFHERVREAYMDLAKKEPGRFVVVDGTRPIGEVKEAICKRVDLLREGSR